MKQQYLAPKADLLQFRAMEDLADVLDGETEPPADESFNLDDLFNKP